MSVLTKNDVIVGSRVEVTGTHLPAFVGKKGSILKASFEGAEILLDDDKEGKWFKYCSLSLLDSSNGFFK